MLPQAVGERHFLAAVGPGVWNFAGWGLEAARGSLPGGHPQQSGSVRQASKENL